MTTTGTATITRPTSTPTTPARTMPDRRPAPPVTRDGRACEACGTGFYIVDDRAPGQVTCVRCSHGESLTITLPAPT